jgi:hypothetical protein
MTIPLVQYALSCSLSSVKFLWNRRTAHAAAAGGIFPPANIFQSKFDLRTAYSRTNLYVLSVCFVLMTTRETNQFFPILTGAGFLYLFLPRRFLL